MSGVERDDELLDSARREVFVAVGRYAEGWGTTEGGIVTKLVVLVEIANPAGERVYMEIRGAGGEGEERLQPWDRSGLLFEALHDPTERMGYER